VELSLEVYNKYFESAGFNHGKVFNNYVIIRHLTSNIGSENDLISLFNEKMGTEKFFPVDTKKNKYFFSFFFSFFFFFFFYYFLLSYLL